jgi:transposase
MKKVGSAPILHHFIQRMGVVSIIDSLVPSHPDRKISHGEAVAGLMAYLLNGGRALYRVEKWAEETSILSQIFSGYRPQDWTDDRLADTLDALYRKGLELVQGSISAHIVGEFGLQLDEIHYDPTSVSLWGTYDSSTGEPAVLITQGYSKDHRSDLKQVVVGMAVTGDGKVPLVSGTHDGNTAECTMPLPYWERLRQLAAKSSFCFIGDCKIATQETLQELCIQDGEFLAPLPMSVSQKQELVKTLKEDNLVFTPITPEEEGQKPIYKRRTSQPGTRRKRELQPLQAVEEREEWEGGKVSEESPGKVSPPYEVCEAPWIIEDKQGRRYTLRKLIFRSAQLTRQHADTRERHLEKAEAELRALGKKLNKRKLKTREAIEAVAAAIIKAHKVEGMIGFHIQEQINLLRKKLGRGKPGPKSRYQIEEEVTYRLWVQRHPEVIRQKALLDGIFLMVSNRDPQQWPASRLLGLYKRQYKVEQVIHVLKGPLAVVPMLLEKPERICSMIFILTLALQLYTLIQRQTAQELLRRGYPLEGLMPNKIQTWRPQTNTLLAAFDNINWVEIIREGYSPLRSVTSLNPLQLKILGLLGVPVKDYSIEALIPKSGET